MGEWEEQPLNSAPLLTSVTISSLQDFCNVGVRTALMQTKVYRVPTADAGSVPCCTRPMYLGTRQMSTSSYAEYGNE